MHLDEYACFFLITYWFVFDKLVNFPISTQNYKLQITKHNLLESNIISVFLKDHAHIHVVTRIIG